MPEASLNEQPGGLAPEGAGWFVVNARDARWQTGTFGAYTRFEGETHFERFGINIGVLQPGQANCYYHGEDEQEDFIVLSGECLLIVEDQERPLHRWDFVHCPRWTEHVFVGAGWAKGSSTPTPSRRVAMARARSSARPTPTRPTPGSRRTIRCAPTRTGCRATDHQSESACSRQPPSPGSAAAGSGPHDPFA